MVTPVFALEVWDPEIGAKVRAPRMATLETIRRIRGVRIAGTAKLVDEREIDNGFYPKSDSDKLD
jgi:hypothetical protein